jgi:hypothetical protein
MRESNAIGTKAADFGSWRTSISLNVISTKFQREHNDEQVDVDEHGIDDDLQ